MERKLMISINYSVLISLFQQNQCQVNVKRYTKQRYVIGTANYAPLRISHLN